MRDARKQFAMTLSQEQLVAEYVRAMEDRAHLADLHAAAHEAVEQLKAKSPRSVFVLCSGEYCEGHSPVGVHATLDAAKTDCARSIGGAPVESWKPLRQGDGRTTTWLAEVGACDEWWIYEMPVLEALR